MNDACMCSHDSKLLSFQSSKTDGDDDESRPMLKEFRKLSKNGGSLMNLSVKCSWEVLGEFDEFWSDFGKCVFLLWLDDD